MLVYCELVYFKLQDKTGFITRFSFTVNINYIYRNYFQQYPSQCMFIFKYGSNCQRAQAGHVPLNKFLYLMTRVSTSNCNVCVIRVSVERVRTEPIRVVLVLLVLGDFNLFCQSQHVEQQWFCTHIWLGLVIFCLDFIN